MADRPNIDRHRQRSYTHIFSEKRKFNVNELTEKPCVGERRKCWFLVDIFDARSVVCSFRFVQKPRYINFVHIINLIGVKEKWNSQAKYVYRWIQKTLACSCFRKAEQKNIRWCVFSCLCVCVRVRYRRAKNTRGDDTVVTNSDLDYFRPLLPCLPAVCFYVAFRIWYQENEEKVEKTVEEADIKCSKTSKTRKRSWLNANTVGAMAWMPYGWFIRQPRCILVVYMLWCLS